MAEASITYPYLLPSHLEWLLANTERSLDLSDLLFATDESGVPLALRTPSFSEVFGETARMPYWANTALKLLLEDKYGAANIPDEYYEAKDLYRRMAREGSLPQHLTEMRPRAITGPGELELLARQYVQNQFRYDPATGKIIFAGQRPEQETEALQTSRGLLDFAARTPDMSTIGDPNRNALLRNALDIFEKTQGEQMRNEAAKMGIGRSTSAMKAIADARQRAMQPILEQAIQLENEAINRGMTARDVLARNLLQSAANEMQREQQFYNRGWTLAERESQRLQDQANAQYEELQNLRNLYAGTLGTRLGAISGAAGGLTNIAQADLERQWNTSKLLWDLAKEQREMAMQPGMWNYQSWQNMRDRLWNLFLMPMESIPYGSAVEKGDWDVLMSHGTPAGNLKSRLTNWTRGRSRYRVPTIPPAEGGFSGLPPMDNEIP